MNINKTAIYIFLKWLCKAVIAGIIATCLLSIIGFLYNYTNVHIKNKTGATDYKWESKQVMTTMKEGFAYIRMDENGFNNSYEKKKDSIDILLMGSSHMEAVQMKTTQNVGYLLNESIPEFYTYNIGISGHDIYRVVDNIENATKIYKPKKYVIIETSTVKLDIKNMKQVISGTAKPIESKDTGLIYCLQKIPAFKPIYKQLSIWIGNDSDENNNVESINDETSEISIEYVNTLNEFLYIISNTAEGSNIVPIIFYAPSEKIGDDGKPVYQVDEDYLRVYKETCQKLGITFIDMRDTFKELYEQKNVMAHGFSNTAVGVGHLNKYGHQVIANKLSETIKEMEEK